MSTFIGYNLVINHLYPLKFSEYVEEYSEKYGVEKEWIYAIIKTESNFNTKIVSKMGAIGLMQIMEETAQEVTDDTEIEGIDLKDPNTNIKIGTKYFKMLLEYYNDNYYLALASYNAGIGNVKKWIESGIIKNDGSDIENIPYKETNNYVRKVLKNYRIYKEKTNGNK